MYNGSILVTPEVPLHINCIISPTSKSIMYVCVCTLNCSLKLLITKGLVDAFPIGLAPFIPKPIESDEPGSS
jgi:hypothetical protein